MPNGCPFWQTQIYLLNRKIISESNQSPWKEELNVHYYSFSDVILQGEVNLIDFKIGNVENQSLPRTLHSPKKFRQSVRRTSHAHRPISGLNRNLITKAKNYNAAGTELNFILGLCLRHNILFMRRSNSVLIVKNKVTGHN